MTSTERNNTRGGYAGVKDAEVNKSLPTQGGGAGDRETIEDRFPELGAHLIRMASTGSLGSLSDWGAFFNCLVAALQAAPSEGGEPVAYRQRRAIGGWMYCEPKELEANHWPSPKALYDHARPPAPSEEPLVGWRPIETLPHPVEAGLFYAAIQTRECDGPLRWQVHLLCLDDETHDVHINYEQGWRIEDYEFWQPGPEFPAAPAPDAIRGGE